MESSGKLMLARFQPSERSETASVLLHRQQVTGLIGTYEHEGITC
jgi:hypothetical protein